ncbi:MAG TPA: hypothetical protein VE344_08965 [Methylomirabilota bacterium]|nr:hypothetical protein [Methylomirabilota bacterium]
MNSKASLTLHEKSLASVEKFDYFLCGFAGALFAYIGQNYTPHKFDNWFYYLIPLALVCLTVSLAFGLRRLQLSIAITELNKKIVSIFEECESINNELAKHAESKEPSSSVNLLTGEKLDWQGLVDLQKKQREKAKQDKLKAEIKIKRAEVYGSCQNIFLIVGFLLILERIS